MPDIGPFDATIRSYKQNYGSVLFYGVVVGTVATVGLPSGGGRVGFQVHNPGTTPLWFYPAMNAAKQPQTLAAGDPGTVMVVGGGYGPLIEPCGNGAWTVIGQVAGVATFLVFSGTPL